MKGPGEDDSTVEASIGDGMFPRLREEEGVRGESSVEQGEIVG